MTNAVSNPFRYDFLVLGSGIAGLFYALKTADRGTVAVVTKKQAADSATNWAQGGIAAVTSDEDSFEDHARDTQIAGAGLCNETVVNRVVERGPGMIDELRKLGADFDPPRDDAGRRTAEFDLGREGGHTQRRILHHRDTTGHEIERVLLGRVRAHPNIDLFENHSSVDLLTAERAHRDGENRVLGAYVLDAERGEV